MRFSKCDGLDGLHAHCFGHAYIHLADPFRKHSGGGGHRQVDDIDEFEDEEAFLNLDDILQGMQI